MICYNKRRLQSKSDEQPDPMPATACGTGMRVAAYVLLEFHLLPGVSAPLGGVGRKAQEAVKAWEGVGWVQQQRLPL